MERCEKLEKVVEDAKKWISNVEKYLEVNKI